MNRNWAELLHVIYTHDENWKYFKSERETLAEDHPLLTKTSLSIPEARGGFSFLKRHGLIEDGGNGRIRLTSKGFEVAREHEMERQRAQTNKIAAEITVVLAFGAFVQAFGVAASLTSGPPHFITAILLVILIAILGRALFRLYGPRDNL